MTDQTIEELANQAKEEEQVVAPTSVTDTPPELSPELMEFVGEGKKYATPDIALASLPDKEAHIANLEAQISQQTQVADLLKEFKANQAKDKPVAQVGQPVDVPELVRQELAKNAQRQQFNNNIIKVDAAFRGKFGEEGNDAYAKVAKIANLTVEQLNEITKVAPEVVL